LLGLDVVKNCFETSRSGSKEFFTVLFLMLNFNVLRKEDGGLMNERGSQFRYATIATGNIFYKRQM